MGPNKLIDNIKNKIDSRSLYTLIIVTDIFNADDYIFDYSRDMVQLAFL